MRKLRKGEKVIIVCNDKRNSFNPTVATIKTSGKKWVTVEELPWYFNVESQVDDHIYGGCKDGSYQIFELYDFCSIEQYEYGMKIKAQKENIKNIIKNILDRNLSKIPYEVLSDVSKTLNSVIKNE